MHVGCPARAQKKDDVCAFDRIEADFALMDVILGFDPIHCPTIYSLRMVETLYINGKSDRTI